MERSFYKLDSSMVSSVYESSTNYHQPMPDYQKRFKPVHPTLQCSGAGIASYLCNNDNCLIPALICSHP